MQITYDSNKNQKNIDERNLSFELVRQFEWYSALIWQDTRFNYPEDRFTALGYIEDRLYSLTFTPQKESIRIISFRKANRREIKKYENERH